MVAWFTIPTLYLTSTLGVMQLVTDHVKHYLLQIITNATLQLGGQAFSGMAIIFMNYQQVDAGSHLILQVYLGSTGEEKLYHISVTTVTGQHEGSPTILRNRMGQNSIITVMNMKQTIERCTLVVRY